MVRPQVMGPFLTIFDLRWTLGKFLHIELNFDKEWRKFQAGEATEIRDLREVKTPNKAICG